MLLEIDLERLFLRVFFDRERTAMFVAGRERPVASHLRSRRSSSS